MWSFSSLTFAWIPARVVVRVCSFAKEDDPGNHVVVIDNPSILAVSRSRKLPKPDLGPLRDNRYVLHAQRRAAFSHEHSVFDVAHISDEAHFPDIDLLQTALDKAAACIGIIVGSCCSTCQRLNP